MPAVAKYQQTQIMTASPMELVMMLYDEGIAALDRAEGAFQIPGPDRIQHINNHILRAEDVISELAVSLDLEKGGEIADSLHRLYDFMIYHLSQANVKHIVQPVADVRKMMCELRDAWKKVSQQEHAHADTEPAEAMPARGGILVNG